MGFLKPDVESRQPKSQATPLAEELLDLLRQQLGGREGGVGSGLSPGQKEAGTNITEFIKARQDPAKFEALVAPLRESFDRDTDRGAAEVRESLGAAGGRFSTDLLKQEGEFRGERATELDTLISDMFLREQANLLAGIQSQQQFGIENILPFIQLALPGILGEEFFVTDNPFMTLLKSGAAVGSAAAGKPG